MSPITFTVFSVWVVSVLHQIRLILNEIQYENVIKKNVFIKDEAVMKTQ